MKIPPLALASLAALLVVACGGKVVVDLSAGTAGTGGAGGAVGSGLTTTSASGISFTTSVSSATGGGCPPHSSPGCCPGDGTCCDCVSQNVCTLGPFGWETTEVIAFDDCVCQLTECGTVCAGACVGQGIDMGCPDCAAKSAQGNCAKPFSACPKNTSGG
jgi:hypothetical protein